MDEDKSLSDNRHNNASVSAESIWSTSESNSNETDASSMNWNGSYFHSSFDIARCIGKGGFGVVFEAKHKLDDCHYAIKRINLKKYGRSLQQALREAKALATCEHEHIVRYYHCWIEKSKENSPSSQNSDSKNSNSSDSFIEFKKDDQNSNNKDFGIDLSFPDDENPSYLFIKMELCTQNLENWIFKKEARCRVVESIEIFSQIISGLEYIHLKKMIHRDLNVNSNLIFLCSYGRLVLSSCVLSASFVSYTAKQYIFFIGWSNKTW